MLSGAHLSADIRLRLFLRLIVYEHSVEYVFNSLFFGNESMISVGRLYNIRAELMNMSFEG